jgi:hypothetical protein
MPIGVTDFTGATADCTVNSHVSASASFFSANLSHGTVHEALSVSRQVPSLDWMAAIDDARVEGSERIDIGCSRQIAFYAPAQTLSDHFLPDCTLPTREVLDPLISRAQLIPPSTPSGNLGDCIVRIHCLPQPGA